MKKLFAMILCVVFAVPCVNLAQTRRGFADKKDNHIQQAQPKSKNSSPKIKNQEVEGLLDDKNNVLRLIATLALDKAAGRISFKLSSMCIVKQILLGDRELKFQVEGPNFPDELIPMTVSVDTGTVDGKKTSRKKRPAHHSVDRKRSSLFPVNAVATHGQGRFFHVLLVLGFVEAEPEAVQNVDRGIPGLMGVVCLVVSQHGAFGGPGAR